jgi:putative transposase
MSRLRHRTSPGLTYFVTTKTWQNRALFQTEENASILIECLLGYRERGAYSLHEFVVMPNRLHLLLTPALNTSLEKAMQLIKGGSSHEIHRRRANNLEIWQPGFHESTVRDADDFSMRRRYISENPVAAYLVEHAEDWAYGSASGKFNLDSPSLRLSSGAKAPLHAANLSELKLRPPEEPARCSGAKVPLRDTEVSESKPEVPEAAVKTQRTQAQSARDRSTGNRPRPGSLPDRHRAAPRRPSTPERQP